MSPLTEQLKQWYMKTLPGMNNLVEDLDLKDKWVETAQNCRFEEEPGAVDKRTPVTYFNSTTLGAGAYGVTGLYRYYTSGGTSEFICIHNTTAYVGDDSAGTGAAIRTSLTAGKRTSFVTYKDILIGSNGYDNPWCYDGSDDVSWELGACKVVVSTATGSLTAAKSYSYQVAITVSSATHICGAISNAVTTTTTGAAELTDIPLGPPGTTNRLIYRTKADEAAGTHGNYDLLATLSDNTTVIYTDTTGDGSLGATVAAVSDDMPVGAELRLHRERLFISRDPSNPNKIYYSNPWLPHFIQQTSNLDYMEISPEDGDEISGIPIQLGTMVCIKKNTIRKIHITSPTSGADPTTWYADDPMAWNGSPAPWSITQTPLGIVFLGWDHWYLFDGAGARPIIDEFDVKDILESGYSDVVGFYHKGIMLAAYADKTIANQFHDRIMRYNFKRKTLSYDLWTSTTVSGANCFASKSGDDETGELYYGDSQKGYILKDKESEDSYRLRTKTECLEGTATDVFVGGTESSPYLEIGSTTSSSTIPDDMCIFWDQEDTSPGAGWEDITSTYSERFIKISTTAASTAAASTHTHSVTGETEGMDGTWINSGDPGQNATLVNHTHTVSLTSGTATPTPRYVNLRMFKASSCTTSEFPDGAIIMWDQEAAPTGWQTVSKDGYYTRIYATSLGTGVSSTHSHSFSGSTDTTTTSKAQCEGQYPGPAICSYYSHNHTMSGTLASASQDDWELDHVKAHFIKKIGEADTWDGSDQYAYALYIGSSTPTGWTDVSTTYTGNYLKIGPSESPSTGSAADPSHVHSVTAGTTGDCNYTTGTSGSNFQAWSDHGHPWSNLSASSGSSGAPASVTFKMYKIVLGKMKDYNAAIAVSATGGTWTSPSQQINAESLGNLYWNETLATGDTILFHARVGATKATCEAASWTTTGYTNPNGSIIGETANVWFQYKIEFTAVDSTVSNPKVYFTNGYVVKYTYSKGATSAETSVAFVYDVGFRNFDTPMIDKFFKKIGTAHEGEEGSFDLDWETENSNDSFTIDLPSNQKRWDSYFQSTAFGREVKFKVYKNDLYDFRLSEIQGLYTESSVII